MALQFTAVPRDGEPHRGVLTPGDPISFGRETPGATDCIPVTASSNVSRVAVQLDGTEQEMVQVMCRQRLGTIEVKRANGLVAANLQRGEAGMFYPPVDLVLHTRAGAYVTITVVSDRPVQQPTGRGPSIDTNATSGGWGLHMIEEPPPGLDWFVAASMAAILLRQGRRNDPTYSVPRSSLLRACGVWLGAPKSEGWLAGKFRQAGEALAVSFGTNPAQQLAEYVLNNRMLHEGALRALEAEYERRRSGQRR